MTAIKPAQQWKRTRAQNRLALQVAFAAGFLVGVPVTYCLLLLLPGWVGDSSNTPLVNRTHIDSHISANDSQNHNGSLWVNGVYWSPRAEALVEKGQDDVDLWSFKSQLNGTEVTKLEEGCGRMQNRLVYFSDGRKACCRYRHNHDQIQGEIFSFHLGRLLGLQRHLAPSTLSLPDPSSRLWGAAGQQMSAARWSPQRPVVLTGFAAGLLPAPVPRALREKPRRLLPSDLRQEEGEAVGDLVQWSDLLLFDYATANLDRVVNNLFNERWNRDMMSQPVHNLARRGSGGLLLFLDNESGLLHGYRLAAKYEPLHRALLGQTCVFRRSTVQRLYRLLEGDLRKALRAEVERWEPGMLDDALPFLPDSSLRTLRQRLEFLRDHIKACSERFPQRTP